MKYGRVPPIRMFVLLLLIVSLDPCYRCKSAVALILSKILTRDWHPILLEMGTECRLDGVVNFGFQ